MRLVSLRTLSIDIDGELYYQVQQLKCIPNPCYNEVATNKTTEEKVCITNILP